MISLLPRFRSALPQTGMDYPELEPGVPGITE